MPLGERERLGADGGRAPPAAAHPGARLRAAHGAASEVCVGSVQLAHAMPSEGNLVGAGRLGRIVEGAL